MVLIYTVTALSSTVTVLCIYRSFQIIRFVGGYMLSIVDFLLQNNIMMPPIIINVVLISSPCLITDFADVLVYYSN